MLTQMGQHIFHPFNAIPIECQTNKLNKASGYYLFNSISTILVTSNVYTRICDI